MKEKQIVKQSPSEKSLDWLYGLGQLAFLFAWIALVIGVLATIIYIESYSRYRGPQGFEAMIIGLSSFLPLLVLGAILKGFSASIAQREEILQYLKKSDQRSRYEDHA